jgi:hypothetical protein
MIPSSLCTRMPSFYPMAAFKWSAKVSSADRCIPAHRNKARSFSAQSIQIGRRFAEGFCPVAMGVSSPAAEWG